MVRALATLLSLEALWTASIALAPVTIMATPVFPPPAIVTAAPVDCVTTAVRAMPTPTVDRVLAQPASWSEKF